MCSSNAASEITKSVADKSKQIFGGTLKNVILYGSYARGDYDDESDVDIMILADIPAEECYKYRKLLLDVTSELGLKFDTLVSVNVRDLNTFNKWRNILPFYKNINREGVNIIG